MHAQRQSTQSTQVERQLKLLPERERKPCPPPDLNYIRGLPSFRRALRYAVSLADLEPKDVYGPLEMDKSIWSKIENGGMSFPADEILRLCEITQNDSPLLWLIHARGWDVSRLVWLKTPEQEENERLKAENAELRRKLQLTLEIAKELRQ
jgi:hypothetical protein